MKRDTKKKKKKKKKKKRRRRRKKKNDLNSSQSLECLKNQSWKRVGYERESVLDWNGDDQRKHLNQPLGMLENQQSFALPQ